MIKTSQDAVTLAQNGPTSTPGSKPLVPIKPLAQRFVPLDLSPTSSGPSSNTSSTVDLLESLAESWTAAPSRPASPTQALPPSRVLTPIEKDFDGVFMARAALRSTTAEPQVQQAAPAATSGMQRAQTVPPPVKKPWMAHSAPSESEAVKNFSAAVSTLKKTTRPARRAMAESVVVSAIIGGVAGTVIGCSHLGPFGLGMGLTGIALSLLFALPLGWIQGRMQQQALLQDPEVQRLLAIVREAPEGVSQTELTQAKKLLRFMDGHIFEQSILPKWLKTFGSRASDILQLERWAGPAIQKVVVSRVDKMGAKMGAKLITLKAEVKKAEAQRAEQKKTFAQQTQARIKAKNERYLSRLEEAELPQTEAEISELTHNEDAKLAVRLAQKLEDEIKP